MLEKLYFVYTTLARYSASWMYIMRNEEVKLDWGPFSHHKSDLDRRLPVRERVNVI